MADASIQHGPGDPWIWDESTVLQEVCTANRDWHTEGLRLFRPNYARIYEVFQQNEVNGRLLFDLTEQNLKDDFQIAALKDRKYVMNAVQVLARMSPKHQQNELQQIHVSQRSSYPSLGQLPGLTQPNTPQSLEDGPARVSGFGAAHAFEPLGISRSVTPTFERPTSHGSIVTQHEISPVESTNLVAGRKRASTELSDQPSAPPASTGTPSPPRKIRRIQPVLITSEIDADRLRTVPTAADVVSTLMTDAPAVTPKRISPVAVIEHSRVENSAPVATMHLTSKASATLVTTTALPKAQNSGPGAKFRAYPTTSSRRREGLPHCRPYLGRKQHRVERIFYPNTRLGQIIQDRPEDLTTDFHHLAKDHSRGQLQYVGAMIKRYLKTVPHHFLRRQVQHTAVLAYNPRLSEWYYQPSFTLFTPKQKAGRLEVQATRCSYASWPELRSKLHGTALGRQGEIDVFNTNLLTQVGSSSWDPDSLSRWQEIEGADEVLPLYGDSDSDFQYDLDTWNEIEKERGEQHLTRAIRSNRRPITLEQVNDAIDEAMDDIIRFWIARKLPRFMQGDWKLWRSAHKHGNVRQYLAEFKGHIDRLNEDRIPKMRNEIASERWTSQHQVRQQTGSMMRSLFDREQLKHKISVLISKKPPTKPAASQRRREAAAVETQETRDPADTDVETLGSSSDEVDPDDDDDDMDSFIVSDDPADHGDAQSEEVDIDIDTPAGSDADMPIKQDSCPADQGAMSVSSQQSSGNRRVQYSSRTKLFSRSPASQRSPSSTTHATNTIFSTAGNGSLSSRLASSAFPSTPRRIIKVKGNSCNSPIVIDSESSPATPRFAPLSESETEDEEPISRSARRSLFLKSKPIADESSNEVLEESTEQQATDDQDDVPISARKRKVSRDKVAQDRRRDDRVRLEEQARRRQILDESRATATRDPAQKERVIVNASKLDSQGFVYLSELASRRVKAHQIEGIRFLWDQIVTGHGGCLLAHTMGLGKTMQTICFLEALATASRSMDETVRNQVPDELRVSRTLIICPAGIVDNWVDELLIWGSTEELGDYYKITAKLSAAERSTRIETWAAQRGILVISYELFRKMASGDAHADMEPVTDDLSLSGQSSQIAVAHALLNSPTLVVVDEAHAIRNESALISRSVKRITTRSRIALTGSPLANNLAEYYAMVDWVDPGYMGTEAEFRQEYRDPIEIGLYSDSTASQARSARKKLEVLHKELAPKVSRMTMVALREDLPPKKEFVITVPLTEIQKQMYSEYVRLVQRGAQKTSSGKNLTSNIFSWMSMLMLVNAHPLPFMRRLEQHLSTSMQNSDTNQQDRADVNDGTVVPDDLPVSASTKILDAMNAIHQNLGQVMDTPDISHKVKLFLAILDHARAVKDKVLTFSRSLDTLDYLQRLCEEREISFKRLDGRTQVAKRQHQVKEFNKGNTCVYLISTNAGGQGLNIFGANRVIIFDFGWNPINEEQAIGRAYRIGQTKPVFVYRFKAGGTFETVIENKTIWKMQLASRCVDKQNPVPLSKTDLGKVLQKPADVERKDLSRYKGIDPSVLDHLLSNSDLATSICQIIETDCYAEDDNVQLNDDEKKEVLIRQKILNCKRSIATLDRRCLKQSSTVDQDKLAKLKQQLGQYQLEEQQLANTALRHSEHASAELAAYRAGLEARAANPSGGIAAYRAAVAAAHATVGDNRAARFGDGSPKATTSTPTASSGDTARARSTATTWTSMPVSPNTTKSQTATDAQAGSQLTNVPKAPVTHGKSAGNRTTLTENAPKRVDNTSLSSAATRTSDGSIGITARIAAARIAADLAKTAADGTRSITSLGADLTQHKSSPPAPPRSLAPKNSPLSANRNSASSTTSEPSAETIEDCLRKLDDHGRKAYLDIIEYVKLEAQKPGRKLGLGEVEAKRRGTSIPLEMALEGQRFLEPASLNRAMQGIAAWLKDQDQLRKALTKQQCTPTWLLHKMCSAMKMPTPILSSQDDEGSRTLRETVST